MTVRHVAYGNPEDALQLEEVCRHCEGKGHYDPVYEDYETPKDLYEDYDRDKIVSLKAFYC
tara:strand:+ start:607 stop:789 length:183 start_codon:yes stop_codon:yes gene_type:complete